MELERARMRTMQTGYDNGDKSLLHVFAYVSFQELATRISHRNTGKYTQEPVADRLLARVAADENLHMIFYRNLVTAALQVAPDDTMRAIADEVIGFRMPGAVISGFLRKAALIAKAGIYDLRIHHDDVIWPLLRHWGVFHLDNLGPRGEIARTELAEFLSQLRAKASRFEQRRDHDLARLSA
jgi:acyl-[acyl-carrier-protein] desaturase